MQKPKKWFKVGLFLLLFCYDLAKILLIGVYHTFDFIGASPKLHCAVVMVFILPKMSHFDNYAYFYFTIFILSSFGLGKKWGKNIFFFQFFPKINSFFRLIYRKIAYIYPKKVIYRKLTWKKNPKNFPIFFQFKGFEGFENGKNFKF